MIYIHKDRIINNIFYILLFLSFLHAVLRLNDTSSFSLYRVLMPISLVMLTLMWKSAFEKLLILLIVLFYNFIMASFYSNNLFHYSVMLLHYFSIFNIFLITYYLYETDGFTDIYNFLNKYIIFTLFIAILEIVFSFHLPNTAIYSDGSISVFNWNQNEYSTILLSFIPLLLVYNKNILAKISILSLIVYIVYINDSKLALIGIIIAILLYIIKKNILEIHLYIKYIFIIILVFIIIILFLIPYDNIYVTFRDYKISIYELLGMPISHILTLTPFEDTGGSVSTRANAIIYALLELKNSDFFGIGIGNTLVMLEKPEYMLKSAKSIHNLPIQLLVEHGIWILFIYIYLLYLFVKLLIKQNLKDIELVVYIAIPSIFIGSMGSSIGIFANYFLFVCIFLMILHYNYSEKEKDAN